MVGSPQRRISGLGARQQLVINASLSMRTFLVRNNAIKRSILILTVTLMGILSGRTQNYSIDWYKTSGGGGTSSNGQYVLSGTIGQHDVSGPLTGGTYSLTGGFWAIYALQTPGSPLLRVFLTATNTSVVAWPAPSTGFHLQQNPDIRNSNWSGVTNTVNAVNGENQVTISPPLGNRFYRLIYP